MLFKLETFFFETPIYTEEKIITITNDDFQALFHYPYKRDVEGYNPNRKVLSTFIIDKQLTNQTNTFLKDGGFSIITLKCKRYHDSFYFYVLWNPAEKIIMKIGQYPTVADFHIGEIKQYNKLIPEEKLKELTRAIGLAANGVGIGSFVYLRRIFEYLISEAYQIAISENSIDEEAYQKSRMDKKIELLKGHLPGFLVENKGMYSILSLGIHDLDEKTCLAHFDTLKMGIELILDEKLDEVRKKAKIEDAKKKLSHLKGEIKNGN